MSAWKAYKEKLGTTRPWDLLNPNAERSSDLEANTRFSMCLDCPELVKLTKQCKQCGCVMTQKVKLKAAICPIGKW